MVPLIRITTPIIAQAQPTMIRKIQSSGIDIVAQIVQRRSKQMLHDGHQHAWYLGRDEHFTLEPGTVGVAGAGGLVRALDFAFDVREDLLELLHFDRAAVDDVFETAEGCGVVADGVRLQAAVGGAAETPEAAAVVFEEGAGGGDHHEGEGGGVEVVDWEGS